MSWNYRLVRRIYQMPDGEKEIEFAIHEAYYPKDSDEPDSITVEPVFPTGSTWAKFQNEMSHYLRAALQRKSDVLNWEDFDE